MHCTQVAYGGCWKCPQLWQRCSSSDAALRRIPEWLRPLVRNRDRPRHLAPVAHGRPPRKVGGQPGLGHTRNSFRSRRRLSRIGKREILQDDRTSPGRERGHAALLEHGRRAALDRQPRVQGAAQPGKPRAAAGLSAACRRRERAGDRLRHRRGNPAPRTGGRRAWPRRRGRHLRADARRPLGSGSTRAGCTMSRCCLGDAQVFGFEQAAFDVATSRMGVMFFADPVAAFRNIGGALKPGGRLVFACWAPLAENRHWLISYDIALRHLGAGAVDRSRSWTARLRGPRICPPDSRGGWVR